MKKIEHFNRNKADLRDYARSRESPVPEYPPPRSLILIVASGQMAQGAFHVLTLSAFIDVHLLYEVFPATSSEPNPYHLTSILWNVWRKPCKMKVVPEEQVTQTY